MRRVVVPGRAGAAATLALAALTALLAAPATPAAAQVVHGTLVRQSDGRPLPDGVVELTTNAGNSVDSTRSGPDGRFTLHASAPGTYVLYFMQPGYTTVPSDTFTLARGQTVVRRFAVPLIGAAAMERVGQVIDLEKRLQGNITKLCGERPRSWEAGLLVGTVRDARTRKPLPGALVQVKAPAKGAGKPFHRATLTSANGVYVVCNVPAGTASLGVTLRGYHPDVGPVEARAGDVGWYDIQLRPARTGGPGGPGGPAHSPRASRSGGRRI